MFKRLGVFVIAACISLHGGSIMKSSVNGDSRRPVWNIGHMANAMYQVEDFLDGGANSVEFDVSFDKEGNAEYTYHGFPCDCFRICNKQEYIIDYVKYLRNLTAPGDPKYRKELVLLVADMKISGLSKQQIRRAGIDIADIFIKYYWQQGNLPGKAYLLIFIPSIKYSKFLKAFYQELERQGFDRYKEMIGISALGNEDLKDIKKVWQSLNIEDHIWLGDGITNCLPRGTDRLKKALKKRDKLGKTYIDKVYWWTLDLKPTMRKGLRLDVDGVITNYPQAFAEVLKESEFSSRFRMATIQDNPWAKFTKGANIDESNTDPQTEEL